VESSGVATAGQIFVIYFMLTAWAGFPQRPPTPSVR